MAAAKGSIEIVFFTWLGMGYQFDICKIHAGPNWQLLFQLEVVCQKNEYLNEI